MEEVGQWGVGHLELQSCVNEERDPGTDGRPDEIKPGCLLGLPCHKFSLGCTELEVHAEHPGHGGKVGAESYRSETEKRGPHW